MDIGVLARDIARDNRRANGNARRQAFALFKPFTALVRRQTAKERPKAEKGTHRVKPQDLRLFVFLSCAGTMETNIANSIWESYRGAKKSLLA
jgi:hypothetical protein